MVQDSPSRKLDQYIVRFPDGMRDRIKDAAQQNNRSMNAEIIARLEESFQDHDDFSFDADDIVSIVQRAIDQTFGKKIGPVLTIHDARDQKDPITRKPTRKVDQK